MTCRRTIRLTLTHEGELDLAARAWQQANNTCGFSNGLGVVEVAIALLVLANPFSKWLGHWAAYSPFARRW